MKYFDELKRAMEWLGTKPNTVFTGQAIGFSGHAISNTMANVPQDKRIELPVRAPKLNSSLWSPAKS